MTENVGNLELKQRHLKNQPSTLQIRKQQAVSVRRAYKRYGTKRNPFVILDGLNMTVPKGAIYGLLGASGCGKTTLLSCIVGRRVLNSGEMWVLGGTPGSKGSGVPGPRIGYMPQEVALYDGFTIKETLLYFGWIAGMTKPQIKDRTAFLINLLMLPESKEIIKNLSGGQRRRVSLASALIHEPELLILDEPTVGVDPLLRQNIWNHLVEITKEGRTTVIITTHYIDETRQAHLIGLMRGGYFLAEESPQSLLQKFNTDTLEDVFLKLSVIQNIGRRRRSSIAKDVTNAVHNSGVINESAVIDDLDSGEMNEMSGEFGDNVSLSSRSVKRLSIANSDDLDVPQIPDILPEENTQSNMSTFTILQGHHMSALIWKNYLWMLRNIPVMLFILVLPVVQVLLFCLAIGHDPIDLPVAVVNHETNNEIKCRNVLTCNSTKLSCNYLQYLEERAFKLAYYDSEESAITSVLTGKTYASIVIHHNYSLALRARINNWARATPWNIKHSEVEVLRDTTSKDIATFLQYYLYDSFRIFIENYLQSCKFNKHAVSIPIQWKTPVYGLAYPNFTDFATPGLILTIIFFLAVALTSGAMLIERNEGSLERSLVIGISGLEFLVSHVITQFVVMTTQTITVIACVFFLFDMTLRGSLGLVIVLTLLTGFCGMCFGFVVSCVCDSERTATYMAMGSFLPMITLCGIIWPIEAMHNLLQILSIFLPLTKATESMRSILQRGWGFSSKIVYTGFISVGVWIVIFLTISILFLKFKKG